VTGEVLVAVSVLVTGSAASLAVTHARRVGRATSGRAGKLVGALKKVPATDRADALLRGAEAGTWEHRFAGDLVDARRDELRVQAANEALASLEHALEAGAKWPGAALRIVLFGGWLLVIVAFLLTQNVQIVLAIVVISLLSAGVIFQAARRSRELARTQRRDIDALVEVVLGSLARETSERPSSRRRRWGSR
jgi:Flp pilus assembly protein TadB